MAQGSVGVRALLTKGPLLYTDPVPMTHIQHIPSHRVGEGPVIRKALVAPEVLVAPVGDPSLADSQADLVVRVARVATCFRVVPAGQGVDLAVVVS